MSRRVSIWDFPAPAPVTKSAASQRKMHCRAGYPKNAVLPCGVPTKGGPSAPVPRPPRMGRTPHGKMQFLDTPHGNAFYVGTTVGKVQQMTRERG